MGEVRVGNNVIAEPPTSRILECDGDTLVYDMPTGQVMQVYPAALAIVTDTGSANLPLPSLITHP